MFERIFLNINLYLNIVCSRGQCMLNRFVFYFLCVFLFQTVYTRFITFSKLTHPKTSQQILLIGDCHGKERFASQNRAAIINIAKTLDAHIIVEDMSDYSCLARYVSKDLYDTNDFFSYHSLHSKKRMAYTSLSLTYHCQRKDVSVNNVEFRHGGGFGNYSFLPNKVYYALLNKLVKSVSNKTISHLSKDHRACLQEIMPIISAYIEQNSCDTIIQPVHYDDIDMHLSEIDMVFCFMLDILIMQDVIEQMEQNPSKPIIIAAGAMHIENVKAMLNGMGYATQVDILREPASFRELQLRDVFKKYVLSGDQQMQQCSSRTSIGFNDRKRVYWSVTKKAVVSGSLLSSLASLFYVCSRHSSW